MHDQEPAAPELKPALDDVRTRLLHGRRDGVSDEDLLRTLAEAVDHQLNSVQHHAARVLRAAAGDEGCRDTHIEDSVALAEGVALAPAEYFEYMVCVAGACERPTDDDLPLPEAVARMHELARREGDESGADAAPVQLVAYTREAVAQMAARAEGTA